jgi:CheY-like chemotaxis protein
MRAMSDTGAPDQPRRTVLLAEDSPGDVALLREAFRSRSPGIVIEQVGDGLSALRRLELPDGDDRPRVDLLILDLNLPRLDGRGVLARAKALQRRVPTIVLTGSIRRADRDDCLRLGAVHYALKPSYFGEWLRLAQLVTSYLRRTTAEDPHTPTPLGSATLV